MRSVGPAFLHWFFRAALREQERLAAVWEERRAMDRERFERSRALSRSSMLSMEEAWDRCAALDTVALERMGDALKESAATFQEAARAMDRAGRAMKPTRKPQRPSQPWDRAPWARRKR